MGDANLPLDKTLERALHIEAVTRIEEKDEPRISAIPSNEKTQLDNSINDLVRKLQINQSNRQDKQKFLLQKERPKEFLRGSERSSRETGDRKRNYNSYNRSRADNRETNYDFKQVPRSISLRHRVLSMGGYYSGVATEIKSK